ncbi:DUF6343 family protein [Streptomyces sp. enrichment culture]|uniref:DUF6343 family protein n=1 Tax=Streptomyces sp. enrichment culture TaxID=1795815 RepID=UPI003F54B36A
MSEPLHAHSALRLRLLLSALFVPLFLAGTAFFGVWAADTGPGENPGRGTLVVVAVVCGAFALLAAADLMVVVRRLGGERGSGTR